MDKINLELFEELGFTKNEIKIYFYLLKFGENTTGPIIKETKISASKIYLNLNKLISKGLVSFIIKNKTKYFQANLPEKLLEYIEKKEKDISNKKKNIQKIIPDLKKLNKVREKEQNAQIFIGFEGIKTIFNIILDNLKEGEEYYSFSQGDEVNNKEILLFYIKHHQKRVSKKIKLKLIADSNIKKITTKLPNKYLKIKYLKNPFPLGTIIFKDYVINYSFEKSPIGYLIKSESIANYYKAFFEDLWNKTK
jgi:HTH-type transcriptional regulator, sugar sensing transcriptional regulator